MTTSTDSPKQIHQGRNIKRFREMLGWKQDALAASLGGDWTQKRVSLLEGREVIEEDIIRQVADILKVPAEAIKNFNEETALNIISNTFTSNDNSTSIAYQSPITFNPIDKMVELFEENKKLYERLLEKESQLIELLREKRV